MKINEIFYSLQGEGHHSGRPAIFVRLSGCNLKCPFCDTAHQDGIELTDEEVYDRIAAYPTKMVVLTGGEPSLFVTDAFVEGLKARGYYVAIETNGTHRLPSGIDWVTLSPKDPFVDNTAKALPVLASCDELKVIYMGDEPKAYNHIMARYRYLQPCDTGNKTQNEDVMQRCVEYIKAHPEWQLSVQLHKILGIR